MREMKLTPLRAAATWYETHKEGRTMDTNWAKAGPMMVAAFMGTSAISGCINVAAPEEPIVIQLDINIRAEVLYRLAEDASNTIDENADIF
ncbi:YnbE family lipoprotein [Erythrobacter sp. Alg231-14]|uniref:YnbE family lipoprotein n=1 Tax=Erythrobacter sp. Alg231-14 TaxID=1922225 RepID=UPI00307CB3B0